LQAEEREGLPLQMGVDPLPLLQYSRQGVGGGMRELWPAAYATTYHVTI
jgi:hypothetical protein